MKYNSLYYDNCLAEMKEMFNLSDKMFFELHDGFFEIASQQIDLLRAAWMLKDFQQLILHSHTLKGSSASLRHMSISLIAAEMEQHAKEKAAYNYAIVIYNLAEEIAKLRSQYQHWKSINTHKINNED